MSDIGANLERVRERIARAAERGGRRPDDVLLIGVSKTVEVERIQQAVAAGVPVLGENRVQEAKEKVAALGRPVPWHLIGHLQTNKVREALELFDLVHSLDRLDLATELDRRASARGARAVRPRPLARSSRPGDRARSAGAPARTPRRGAGAGERGRREQQGGLCPGRRAGGA